MVLLTLCRDVLRLLYWAYFKPSGFVAHFRLIAPELTEVPMTWQAFWYAYRSNAELRSFLQRTIVIIIAPFIVFFIFDLLNTSVSSINGDRVLFERLGISFVFFSILLILSIPTLRGKEAAYWIEPFIVLILIFSISIFTVGTSAIIINAEKPQVLYIIDKNFIFGCIIGTLIIIGVDIIFSVFIGKFSSLMILLLMILSFLNTKDHDSMNTLTLILFLGILRFSIFIFEFILAIWLYDKGKRSESPIAYFIKSPVYFDDRLMLPQPFLSAFLIRIISSDLHAGLHHMAYVASNPLQRWAVQRTLRKILEQNQVNFYSLVHHILKTKTGYPIVYHTSSLVGVFFQGAKKSETDDHEPYFTAKLLLAELVDPTPFPGLPSRLLQWTTSWLRLGGRSLYIPLAEAYVNLLNKVVGPQEVLPHFEAARMLTHGEEIYQGFRIADMAMHCRTLQEIAQRRHEFDPLFTLSNPLRPDVITAFRRLYDAATDAMAFLTTEHVVTRRDALLQAQGVLEEARRESEPLLEPERWILLQIIEHWRRIFAEEGSRVAERAEVSVIPNPYVAGRALSPADGTLFVDRRDIFQTLEETLQSGVTIILYGQRRVGKTSILLHLHQHLPHNILSVYINLQRQQVDTTAGFLFALANHIARQMQNTGWAVPSVPSLDVFRIEAFITFDEFLANLERNSQPNQQIALVFDEFEELERQVDAGYIDQRIFSYLRGVTQTGHGLPLVFAGLHTLEQMSRDYWHPFFLSVKPIKVTYLTEAEAWQLIRSPVDSFPLQFEEEAIELIITITHGHAYLVQDLCHNLVVRLNSPLHRSNHVTVADVNAVIDRTLESGTYYFADYVWGWSGDEEKLALTVIADRAYQLSSQPETFEGHLDGWVHLPLIENYLGPKAITALNHLRERDILEERPHQDTLEYRFQVELSCMWVARTHPLARTLREQARSEELP